eukprot:6180268-Pleurochrysis_carterae.AAC.3
MFDKADIRAKVPAGAPQGDSRADSELVETAKTPSPRPIKTTGGKRPRGSEKSPSPIASLNKKAQKSCQNWGSVSTQQSDAYHPGSSSKNNKGKSSSKKPAPKALPYKGFRIPQNNNASPKSKGKGIMQAKKAAAHNGNRELKKVRNSVRFAEDTTTASASDTTTNEESTNEADHLPEVSETEGDQLASDTTKESVPSSTTEGDEAVPYVSVKKFSIADEAKVRNPRLAHTKIITVCFWLFAFCQAMNDHESPSQERDSEEGFAPSFSFVSLRNKPNHSAYCTTVEFAQRQTLFCPLPNGVQDFARKRGLSR